MVQYEDLVTQPEHEFEEINRIIQIPALPKAYAHVHSQSIGRNKYPEMSQDIEDLCEDLHNTLLHMSKKSKSKFPGFDPDTR